MTESVFIDFLTVGLGLKDLCATLLSLLSM